MIEGAVRFDLRRSEKKLTVKRHQIAASAAMERSRRDRRRSRIVGVIGDFAFAAKPRRRLRPFLVKATSNEFKAVQENP